MQELYVIVGISKRSRREVAEKLGKNNNSVIISYDERKMTENGELYAYIDEYLSLGKYVILEAPHLRRGDRGRIEERYGKKVEVIILYVKDKLYEALKNVENKKEEENIIHNYYRLQETLEN